MTRGGSIAIYLCADGVKRGPAAMVAYLRDCAKRWRESGFKPCGGVTNEMWASELERRAEQIERETRDLEVCDEL